MNYRPETESERCLYKKVWSISGGVAEIQELGQVGSYMLDIMDIIISEKEFFNNIVFLWR